MSEHEDLQVMAEIAVDPIVGEERRRELVAKAVEGLRGPLTDVQVGPLSTRVTGGLTDVLHAVERAHALTADSCEHVVTSIRLESKRGDPGWQQRLANTEQLAHTTR